MVVAVPSPLLTACDHERAKAFSLIDMVPDFEEITIDEEDIYEETEEMINRCPQAHAAADLEEVNINDSTISLGRRAVHPLKSSLTRSSGCTSAASTEEASSMMDESSTMMLDESLLMQSGFSRSQIKCTAMEARQVANAKSFKRWRSRRLSFEEMWDRATGAIRRR